MAKRRKRARRPGWVPWAAAVAVLAVALWLLLTNAVFVVREVQVVGAGEIPEADVRRLSGIQLGSRLTSLNAEQVRLHVESDGRVAFVSLGTRLPNRVVLTVRPRSEDAVMLQAGKIVVLDSDGYVVSVTDRLPTGNAVYVTGIRVANPVPGRQLDLADGRVGCMRAVLEALKEQGVTAYVSELSVADTADLRIITRTGITVLLGDSEDMPAKITWMAGALSDLEARGETTGTLDVSSATKADFAPPPVEATPEPEETPMPAGQISSIDGVIYIDGVPMETPAPTLAPTG